MADGGDAAAATGLARCGGKSARKIAHVVILKAKGKLMQRDMDYVRELLLKIEDSQDSPRSDELLSANADPDEYKKLSYHLNMLINEAGLVTGIPAHHYTGRHWIELNLTWQGHEFLDAIRDAKIWRHTRETASNAGGWTLEILKELATAYLKAQIAKTTGLSL